MTPHDERVQEKWCLIPKLSHVYDLSFLLHKGQMGVDGSKGLNEASFYKKLHLLALHSVADCHKAVNLALPRDEPDGEELINSGVCQ